MPFNKSIKLTTNLKRATAKMKITHLHGTVWCSRSHIGVTLTPKFLRTKTRRSMQKTRVAVMPVALQDRAGIVREMPS
jgi:hypothetical protein